MSAKSQAPAACGRSRAVGQTRSVEYQGSQATGEVDGQIDERKGTRKNGIHPDARQAGAQVRCVTGDDVS